MAGTSDNGWAERARIRPGLDGDDAQRQQTSGPTITPRGVTHLEAQYPVHLPRARRTSQLERPGSPGDRGLDDRPVLVARDRGQESQILPTRCTIEDGDELAGLR
jgi:hypothetical protein